MSVHDTDDPFRPPSASIRDRWTFDEALERCDEAGFQRRLTTPIGLRLLRKWGLDWLPTPYQTPLQFLAAYGGPLLVVCVVPMSAYALVVDARTGLAMAGSGALVALYVTLHVYVSLRRKAARNGMRS